MYRVTGGEYTSMEFLELVEGTEETHGPFKTYDAAYDCWATRAWSTVDNCQYRFRIVKILDTDTGSA